jgi:HTH-type transcriptional regulator / antitoxin HigA
MNFKIFEDLMSAKKLLSPPGDTLQDTIEELKISQSDLAKRMKRPVKTINEIIKGKTQILPETAIQLQRVLGISAEFWLEREKQYRLELAEIAEAEYLFSVKDWLTNFPLSHMKSLGWIDYVKENIISKFDALLSFFAVSSIEAYEQYYGNNYIGNVAFRMNNESKKNVNAVNAWIRKGYLQANEINAPEYNKQVFTDNLNKIKSIVVNQPLNFYTELKQLCLSAGVKIVHTPNLPKVKIHASTFWLNDNPVIQLSNYYQRSDIFWFSFFHEVGHILKHGKKDIFVEGMEYTEEGKKKENEANQVAINYTFPESDEKELLSALAGKKDITAYITSFAKKINTHPAIITGRLVKSGILHDSFGWQNEIYKKIELQ